MTQWQSSSEGKKILDKSKKEAAEKRRKRDEGKKRGAEKGKEEGWEKKIKSAMKTTQGLKTVMALIGAEETSNKALQAELTANTATTTTAQAGSAKGQKPTASVASAFLATSMKLNSILKSAKY